MERRKPPYGIEKLLSLNECLTDSRGTRLYRRTELGVASVVQAPPANWAGVTSCFHVKGAWSCLLECAHWERLPSL